MAIRGNRRATGRNNQEVDLTGRNNYNLVHLREEKQLIENLRSSGLFTDPRIGEALLAIPRGAFVPKGNGNFLSHSLIPLARFAI
jgi:hypothetical protein